MIRHIVSWRLKADELEGKAAAAAEIAAALESLVPLVPSIRALTVGADVVGGGNWDLALVADFDSVEGLDAYQSHPEHVAVIPIIRERTAERSCVDLQL